MPGGNNTLMVLRERFGKSRQKLLEEIAMGVGKKVGSPAGVAVEGHSSAKFDRVREAFEAHFSEHNELGAAVAVSIGGETVVELWGGWKDPARTRPWTRDTKACLYSTTKAITGVCFAMVVDRGLAAYDDKVSKYWPEFAVEGKGDVTVGMLLSHQSGLTGFVTPADVDDLYRTEASAARLAAQAPFWEPGTAAGYNPITIGILATALFSRIEGRSIKRFVAEEIAAPFGLDVSIGLGREEADLAAEMIPPPESAQLYAYSTPAQNATRNPIIAGSLGNDPAWRDADLPSGNGYGNARSMMGLFDRLLGDRPGRPALARREAIALATRPWSEGIDLVKGIYSRWGAGFMINADGLYGPHQETFYHTGWGGSFALADPVADLAMAYTMNRMGDLFDRDPRRTGLVKAVYASLGETSR
ncbi:MAG: Penicillin-binding protein beta-lactamase class [Caulobacteraceae bacterium]|jgi:CubicO group peptidase (beta-lactamase class C family)|nr:Penicillin-binding protein beta-lactamase class [Caulobacteraceae bacterium]